MLKYWRDILHYGSAGLLAALALLSDAGINLPGVVVDSKTAWVTALGIFAAGLKSHVIQGNKPQ